MIHGRYTTYSNHGCRCDECRAAWARRAKAYLDAHPEQRAKDLARSNAWAEANPERHRAKSREGMRRLRARRRAEAEGGEG